MSRNHHRVAIGALLLATILAGCEDNEFRRQLGLAHQGPDPFTSLPSRPIVIPDTADLPAPDATARSPVQLDPVQDVRTVLSTPAPKSGDPSATEQRLLTALGALDADPDIRALVDREARERSETLFGDVPLVHRLFGVDQRRRQRLYGLDPAAEMERLREAGLLNTPDAPTPPDES